MKERLIKKTFDEAIVTVACIDIATLEQTTLDFTTKVEKNRDKQLKTLRKEHETDSFKLLKVLEVRNIRKTLALSEYQFKVMASCIDEQEIQVVIKPPFPEEKGATNEKE